MSRNKRRAEKIGAYGMIKRYEVLHALDPQERDELERLDDRKLDGKTLSPVQEARFNELWKKAGDLHQEKRRRLAEEPPDTWYEDLKTRMWAKHDAEATLRVVQWQCATDLALGCAESSTVWSVEW